LDVSVYGLVPLGVERVAGKMARNGESIPDSFRDWNFLHPGSRQEVGIDFTLFKYLKFGLFYRHEDGRFPW
jgi:hypothetical protein